jgi:5-methyltetrahydropteroyltriglutamate--homocysteine methyltransferase
MTTRTTPPFRADHVGSLLRPQRLLEARDRHAAGELDAAGLREIEDECIREAAQIQESVGLEAITDGEFRRAMFHMDFLEQIRGVGSTPGQMRRFHTRTGEEIDFAPPTIQVNDTLTLPRSIEAENFAFLRSVTSKTAKICIPSPTMLHFRGGRGAISADAYPDLDQFFADLARVYQEELAALADAGCTYVQLDDTNLAYLCDPDLREGARQRGDDPDDLTRRYAQLINDSIAGRPDGMTVAIHLCRGNFKSAWVAEGGYEPVAEILFNEMNVDAFFLEYDDERSGDFAPLRFLPVGKIVVLGIITSKQGELESKDDLKRRIDEAARYAPLEQLCLSPQCGFSSSTDGNALTHEQQWDKLRLTVETSHEVWG